MFLENSGRGKGETRRQGVILMGEDPNINDGGTLLFVFVCYLNVLDHLFIMISFNVSL
jgi:hypothetical protein